MRVSVSTTAPATAAVDAVAVCLPKPAKLEGPLADLDRALGGRIAGLISDGEVRGAAREVTTLDTAGAGIRARRLILVGLGKQPGGDELRAAAGAAAQAALRARARTLAIDTSLAGLDAADATRCAVDGVLLGAYRFDRFLTKTADRPPPLRSLAVLGGERAAARTDGRGGRGGEPGPRPAEHALQPPGAGRTGRARPRDRPRPAER